MLGYLADLLERLVHGHIGHLVDAALLPQSLLALQLLQLVEDVGIDVVGNVVTLPELWNNVVALLLGDFAVVLLEVQRVVVAHLLLDLLLQLALALCLVGIL